MPSLFRFLTILAILAAIGWGLLYAIVVLVEPTPRQMYEPVPLPQIEQRS